jgi:hypothetical protein
VPRLWTNCDTFVTNAMFRRGTSQGQTPVVRAEAAAAKPTAVEWAFVLEAHVFMVLIVAGVISGLAGWRPAAILLVGAIVVRVATHLTASAITYRRTMRRPWPAVSPLSDEDDDW